MKRLSRSSAPEISMETATVRGFPRILLTGPPGIGKTTVCKKILSLLEETKYNVNGFYTEELRSPDNRRIGFDVVIWKNGQNKTPLARTNDHFEGLRASKYRVGNYHVFVDQFEKAALPVFDLRSDVLLIDEIGKMELFSEKFQRKIEKLFFGEPKRELSVIASIPQRNKIPEGLVSFFDKLQTDGNCQVIEVDRRNRDALPDRISQMIF